MILSNPNFRHDFGQDFYDFRHVYNYQHRGNRDIKELHYFANF